MQLPVRYQVMDSRGPDDNVEANIVHTSAQLELDVGEIAIVKVPRSCPTCGEEWRCAGGHVGGASDVVAPGTHG